MTLLDAAIHVGTETTYGMPVALTRSFEGKADEWTREHAQIESVGFRADMQTVRDDRRHQINMGGSGKIEVDFLNAGMGQLLTGLLGATSGPTQDAATTAYDLTLTSSNLGLPDVSYTVQVERPYADNSGQKEFTHHGAKATGWTLTQPNDGALALGIDFDFEDVDIATAAATAAYPAGATSFFDWTTCAISLDSSAFDEVNSIEFTAGLVAKTDRRYLRASALKKKPVSTGIPDYGIVIDSDFVKVDYYSDFVAGKIIPVIVTWTFADANAIETGKTHTIALTLAACQFDGESPVASLSQTTQQKLPLKVLHDGTNPAVSLAVKSADTAL